MEQWQTDENGLVIFPGDDLEKVKAAFIESCIFHEVDPSKPVHGGINPLQICRYVFRGKRNAEERALQAVVVWANDIDVLEAIKRGLSRGSKPEVKSELSKAELENMILKVFDSPLSDGVVKLKAAELLAKMNGYVQKEVDAKPAKQQEDSSVFFGKIASMLPA